MANDYIDQWNANGVPYDIHDKGRAQPNGVATLDSDGRIPYSQLPESAVELKGYWNANTNTPTLVDGTGNTGDEYYVDVAGSQDLGSGVQYFSVGDRILYINGVWKNINSTAVKSVNGVLPNAQGDVNILNKVYPVGSIYQNVSDATNPGTLFGVGHWTKIEDKFLAALGPTYLKSGGIVGNFSYTLSESNIPAHNHAIGGTLNDQTSGEVANISPVTFNHKHYYNVSHYHTITDNGHYHNLSFDAEGSYTLVRGYGSGSAYNSIQNGTTDQYLPMYASKNYTGITVDERTITGYTDNPDTATIPITQGTHSHGLKTYGSANPTSINTTPPYQAVHTWYRDS